MTPILSTMNTLHPAAQCCAILGLAAVLCVLIWKLFS